MRKLFGLAALVLAANLWTSCTSKNTNETQFSFQLDEVGKYAVQFRDALGDFVVVDTLEIKGQDHFAVAFDTTRLLSFVPVEGELPVVHAVVGPNAAALNINAEGMISGNDENNWLGAQRNMQLDLIAFIDSLDRIRMTYEDSSTFNGLESLNTAFINYADAYRQRILDSLGARPERLSNLLTLYHRIGREPVVEYSEDKLVLLNVLKSLQERYPTSPDQLAFSAQMKEYAEAIAFTDRVMAAEEKYQPGATFPELYLEDPYGQSNHIQENTLGYRVVAVWASWCVECRAELMAAKKAGHDFSNWTFLSLDGLPQQRNPQSDWISAINEDALGGFHLSDLGGQRSSIITALGIRELPVYFVVEDGKITQRTQSLGALK